MNCESINRNISEFYEYAIKQGMDEMGHSAEKIQVTGDALSEISVLMETSIGEIGRQVDQFEV
ncbi:MAG: hypothetical protein IK050_05290 [Lachnospiraceae bacterium]|nr:hypothetical protein [Lachnospiraceae bacterium]